MLQDTFNVKGRLKIKKYDENMQLIEEHDFKNLVVYTGKKLIASRLFADTTPAIPVTSTSSTGTRVTFNYASRSVAPYYPGQNISTVGFVPEIFNLTGRVETCTVNNVVVFSDVVGTVTTQGTLSSLNNSVVTKMAIGEAATTANLSDTSLYIEKARVDIYSMETSFADGDSSVVYIGLFGPGVGTNSTGNSMQEAALFNTDGTMMCRTVFSPVTKQSSESLEIFWTVTIA